jgi:hypothetical protein
VKSDAMQPTCDRVLPTDGPGFPNENKEGRLKDILGLMGISEQPAANA